MLKYPNINTLLCLMSYNRSKNIQQVCEMFLKSASTPKTQIIPPLQDWWFFYPILFLFKTNYEGQYHIISYLIFYLRKSNDFKSNFFKILFLIVLFSSKFPLQERRLDKLFINNLLETTVYDDHLAKLFIKGVFFLVCFKLYKTNKIQEPLFQLFKESPFSKDDSFNWDTYQNKTEYKPEIPDLHDMKMLNKILLLQNADIQLFFEVTFTKEGNIADEDVLSALFNFIRNKYTPQTNTYLSILQYFAKKSKKENPVFQNPDITEYIYKTTKKYQDYFKQTTKPILHEVFKNIDSAKKFYHELKYHVYIEEKESNQTLIKEFESACTFHSSQLSRKTGSKTLSAPVIKPRFVRDSKICHSFCPMKCKVVDPSNNKMNMYLTLNHEIKTKDSLAIFNVLFINQQFSVQCRLHIFKDCLIILSSNPLLELKYNDPKFKQSQASSQIIAKSYKLKSIEYIIIKAAKGSNTDSMLEFFTFTGRSFLIQIIQNDIQTVLKSLPKFPNIKFMQSLKQKDNIAFLESKTAEWINHQISNLSYLMLLNILSGRSFNNPSYDTQPVLPAFLTTFDNSLVVSKLIPSGEFSNEPPKTTDICSKTGVANAALFFDSLIEGDLPNWSTSKTEFNYKLRKGLETNAITAILPQWINVVFGKNMHKQTHNLHKQLFTKDHPSQNPIQKDIYSKEINNPIIFYQSLQNKKIFFSSLKQISKSTPNTYTISIILTKGETFIFDVTLGSKDNINISLSKHFDIKDINITSNSVFTTCPSKFKSFLVYSPEERKVSYIFDNQKSTLSMNLNSETNLFAPLDTKKSFVFCPDFFTVTVVPKIGDKNMKQLCQSPCRITTLTTSSIFKIFAYGTIDGYLSVHNLYNGRLINRVNINNEAESLLITDTNGFIVCITLTNIFSFSVNGELLNSININTQYQNMFQFTVHKSTDYIALVDKAKNLTCFDAIYPNKMKSICQLKQPISQLAYNEEKEVFIVLTENTIKTIHYHFK